MVEGRTVDALRAQHGFSVLVTFARNGREHHVLFDAGLSANGVVENISTSPARQGQSDGRARDLGVSRSRKQRCLTLATVIEHASVMLYRFGPRTAALPTFGLDSLI